MNLSVNLTGFAQLQVRMSSLAKDKATKAGQIANRAGAAVLAKKTRELAPVSATPEGATQNRKRKSGTVVQEQHHKIINWIKVRKSKANSHTKVQNTVTVSKGFHAAMVEFGSIHNTPKPFMRNAFQQNQQSIIDAMAKVLNKQLVKRGA